MTGGWAMVVVIFGLLGGSAGVATLVLLVPNFLKLRAEARKVHGEVEVAFAEREDKHLHGIIEAQTTALVEPLKERVKTLELKVDGLEKELAASEQLGRTAVAYIRSLIAWINKHLPSVSESVPSPPELLRDLI